MRLDDPQLTAGMHVSAATDPDRRRTVMGTDCLDAGVFDPYTPHGRIIAAMCGGTDTMAASRGDLMLLIPIKEPSAGKPQTDSHEAGHRLGEERQLREKALPRPDAMQTASPDPSEQPPAIPPRRRHRHRPLSRNEVIDGILSRARQRVETQSRQADDGEAAALAAAQDRRARDAAFGRDNGKES